LENFERGKGNLLRKIVNLEERLRVYLLREKGEEKLCDGVTKTIEGYGET